MKVAYIGNCDSLGAGIVERLVKEEHDVYVLSDVPDTKKNKSFSKSRNYQIQNEEDLEPVFTSIRPNVVIYAGSGYAEEEWGMKQKKNLSLITAVLEECIRTKVETFVCFSSTEVYGNKAEEKVETVSLQPESRKGMWLLQEEHITQMYHEKYGLNTVILRLDSVFSNEVQVGSKSFLGQIAQSVLNGETVDIEEKMLQPVHISDVADAVKRVIESNKTAVYNVSSSFQIKKSDVIRKVCQAQGKEAKIAIKREQLSEVPVDNSRIKKEQEWTDFWQLEKLLEDKTIVFQKAEKREKKKEVKKEGMQKGARRTLENLVLFLVFGMLYVFTGDHSLFSQVDWLLIYVVIISLCYGVKQGALAVGLSSVLYLVTQKGNILEMTNFYSYVENVLVIVQFVFFGIVVGYTVDTLREENRNKQQEMNLLNEAHEKLKSIHEKNVLVKNEYEKRVLDAKTSLPRLYSIINKINVLDVDRIFMEVLHVVEELLNTDTVCVYKVNPNTTYLRLIASLNDKSPMEGKSWNLAEFPEIGKAIENASIYEGDIWKKEPAMVLPVASSKGCEAVIVIKELPMESMSLYSVNLLRTLLILISETMEKALHYENAMRKERYIEDTDILCAKEFQKAVELAEEKKQRELADYGILKLDTGLDLAEAYEKVGSVFRQMDILGINENGELYVLLANASNQDISAVLERLKTKKIAAKEVDRFSIGE